MSLYIICVRNKFSPFSVICEGVVKFWHIKCAHVYKIWTNRCLSCTGTACIAVLYKSVCVHIWTSCGTPVCGLKSVFASLRPPAYADVDL